METEKELYNDIYKELNDLVGLDAMLKIYLTFKGQQITLPLRLWLCFFRLELQHKNGHSYRVFIKI